MKNAKRKAKEKKASLLEIVIPSGVTVEANANLLKVKGKKGEILKDFKFKWLDLKSNAGKLIINVRDSKKRTKMITNTVESIIKNMFNGVSKGYFAKLSITYAHFPINVVIKPGHVEVTNYFGERNTVKARIMGASKVEIKGKDITVNGCDKIDVGQTAANIERTTKQITKDRRVFQDGIYIVEKGVLIE